MAAHYQESDANVWMINKRVILGSLVSGMYERFRGKPAPVYQEWWTKVHYDLIPLESVLPREKLDLYAAELENEHKNKYFGVFRRNKESPSAEAPNWVVAIRGTEPPTPADLKNDFKIVLEKLNSSKMIPILHAVVWHLGRQHGNCNVNVTGHSLGAAAGLLVCRRLALEGCLVEGHFFNPPFTTLESLARTCAHAVEHAFFGAFPAAKSMEKIHDAVEWLEGKVFHALTDTDKRKNELAELKKLAEANWSPYLYVNKYDLLCCKFLSPFRKSIHGTVDKGRKKWYTSGNESSEKCLGETESFVLFPFANLIVIGTYWLRPISAHRLRNWMDPHVSCKFVPAKLIEWP
ncbi:hypothetical protein MPTK1_3g10110 [Marchantia polymorpha subsp. ruderalis]|uniref:Fungal lipase-like domain-containing protein n=2 Tax=Marchantia polymorpha TaxID=3197 RepID=A0AAF6AZ96_MARPO|nr:hypothetical protein MARPO_0085s0016 [Marchantia polymorpha]BBN05080.1 hypothetical protein Mp_3g10110 [Marchantia polymorpha subsp. ruderalis]|eukprot:PTQ33793.1 hypothetical protein MARPO_0085s0016 [Marchantia polymorpha]